MRYLDGDGEDDGDGEGKGGDWYFADERELDGRREELPGEGLVRGVGGYVGDFYGGGGVYGSRDGVYGRGGGVEGEGLGEGKGRWGEGDWRSMDETALLAVGVLLEEEVGRALGGSGDLVFVEGVGEGEGGGDGWEGVRREGKRERERARKRKRMKVGGGERAGEVVGMATGVEEGGSAA